MGLGDMGLAVVLPDPIDWLRVMCGLFFVPHILAKLARLPLEFFQAAGFPSPLPAMYGAALVETLVCIGLVFGVATSAAAWLGTAYLLLACAALIKVGSQHRWLWNLGGIEYPVFWAGACVVVAISG